MRVRLVLLLIIAMLLTSACDWFGESASDETQQHEQDLSDKQQGHYNDVQPIPWFDYSLTRYLVIELYKAQNNSVATWSYIWDDYHARIRWSCASIGYPITGGTELSSPDQVIQNGASWAVTVGMPEPNGVYPPGTSEGTYVMCLNDDGTIAPHYKEPDVETSPYPMTVVDGIMVPVEGAQSSIKIPIITSAPITSTVTPVP